MRVVNDQRGVVVSWLVKLTIFLAVFCTILFDAGSITTNYFGLQSTADEIAAAMSTLKGSGDTFNHRILEEEAAKLAEGADAKLVSAELAADGVIHIRLKRKATTIIVGNFRPIRSWGKATASGTASTN